MNCPNFVPFECLKINEEKNAILDKFEGTANKVDFILIKVERVDNMGSGKSPLFKEDSRKKLREKIPRRNYYDKISNFGQLRFFYNFIVPPTFT